MDFLNELKKILTAYNQTDNRVESEIEKIKLKYSDKNRFYHNLNHIEFLIGALNEFKKFINSYESVFFAGIYHDIIYDTKEQDNEEQSAECAENHLKKFNIPDNIIIRTKSLILSTKSHSPMKNDFDHKIFLDADLSILGSKRKKYIEYMKSIRKEYYWVEESIYISARKAILEKFLKNKSIFFTDIMLNKYEKNARSNISYELEQLTIQSNGNNNKK